MTNLPDPESVVPQHIEDEDLLAYLDGELSGEAQQETSQHLERCWDCRTRLAATQSQIESFMQIRRSVSPDTVEPPEPAIARFKERLARHAAARSTAAALPRPVAFARRLRSLAGLVPSPSRQAVAVLAMAVLVIVAFVAWFNAPLSADAVLAKAEVQDIGNARRSTVVVKNVIQIEQVDSKTRQRQHLSVLSTLADSASPAMSVSLESPDGALEQEVIASDEQLLVKVSSRISFGQSFARYAGSRRWVPGVSVVEYRKLIRDRGVDQAFVERTGGFVELRHPFRDGHDSGLIETALQLDARSWVPTAIRIVVLENDVVHEFLLTRTEIELLTRTEALAAVFATARARPTVSPDDPARGVAALSRRRPLPLSYDDSVATPAEVAVALALHEANADLGEEINVFQMSDGSLLVQGLLDHAARKQQIEAGLRTVAGVVRVELYTTTSPGRSRHDLYEPPWRSSIPPGMRPSSAESSAIRVADFVGATMPMYTRLNAYFAGRASNASTETRQAQLDKTIAQFVTDVLRRSDDALFNAWALRKLDLQFSHRRVQALPASSVELIEGLKGAHRSQLSATTRALSTIIGKIAGDVPESEPAVAPGAEGDRRSDPRALLQLVTEQNQLVRSLFTTSAASAEPTAALARLQIVLRQLEPGS
jgi:anti-sigma factor RsiW